MPWPVAWGGRWGVAACRLSWAERGLLAARKQWLAGHLQTRGTLVLDAGAVKALATGRKSLLPVGVKALQGSFRRGEMVICVDPDGREIARGLANYSALEAQKII